MKTVRLLFLLLFSVWFGQGKEQGGIQEKAKAITDSLENFMSIYLYISIEVVL